MLDCLDKGEKFLIKVDNNLVWSKAHHHYGNPEIPSICGYNHCGDELNLPFSFEIIHSNPAISLEFSSTLDEKPSDESWGVNNIKIEVLLNKTGILNY